MALNLYILRHFCHAYQVLSSLIFGDVLHIQQLCSHTDDVKMELKLILHGLLDCGYQLSQLNPLFQQAIDNATVYFKQLSCQDQIKKGKEGCRWVFLHPPYHPVNLTSKSIQKLWYNLVGTPLSKPPPPQADQSTGL
jgi:hypothetical protein